MSKETIYHNQNRLEQLVDMFMKNYFNIHDNLCFDSDSKTDRDDLWLHARESVVLGFRVIDLHNAIRQNDGHRITLHWALDAESIYSCSFFFIYFSSNSLFVCLD